MAIINICKNFRMYSPEELRSKAYSGILEANGYDLTDFIEYIFTGYEQEVYDRIYDEVHEKVCRDMEDFDDCK